jgi:hypothetical protein
MDVDKKDKSENNDQPVKPTLDSITRTTALSLSVESLKTAGQPSVLDVLSRAERFKAYILEGKLN